MEHKSLLDWLDQIRAESDIIAALNILDEFYAEAYDLEANGSIQDEQ